MKTLIKALIFTSVALCTSSLQSQTQAPTPYTKIIDMRVPYTKIDRRLAYPPLLIPGKSVVNIHPNPTPDKNQKAQAFFDENFLKTADIFIIDYEDLPKMPKSFTPKQTGLVFIFINCPYPINSFKTTQWLPSIPSPNNTNAQSNTELYAEFDATLPNLIVSIPASPTIPKDDINRFANQLVTDLVTNPTFKPSKYKQTNSANNTVLDTRNPGHLQLQIPGKTIIPLKSHPRSNETAIAPFHFDEAKTMIVDYNNNPGFAPLFGAADSPVLTINKLIIYANCSEPMSSLKVTGLPRPTKTIPNTDEYEEFVGPNGTKLVRFFSKEAHSKPAIEQDKINNKVITAIINKNNS